MGMDSQTGLLRPVLVLATLLVLVPWRADAAAPPQALNPELVARKRPAWDRQRLRLRSVR